MAKWTKGRRLLLNISFCLAAWPVQSLTPSARGAEPIVPLPEAHDVDPVKASLGAKLFADPRLSADQSVSCQSCHLPAFGGADPRRHSVSAFGKVRELNSPSIFNLRFNSAGLELDRPHAQPGEPDQRLDPQRRHHGQQLGQRAGRAGQRS